MIREFRIGHGGELPATKTRYLASTKISCNAKIKKAEMFLREFLLLSKDVSNDWSYCARQSVEKGKKLMNTDSYITGQINIFQGDILHEKKISPKSSSFLAVGSYNEMPLERMPRALISLPHGFYGLSGHPFQIGSCETSATAIILLSRELLPKRQPHW